MTHLQPAFAALFVAVVGCGGSTVTSPSAPYVVNPGADRSMTPSSIDAERAASICGVMDPPFTDDDLFSLFVVGENTPTPPYGGIFFESSRKVMVGEPIVLSLTAYQTNPPTGPGEASPAQQSASVPAGSALQFTFEWGSNRNEVDPNPLDAATVTVLALPAKDGDPLTVRFQLHFTDNRKLDETFSGPLSTAYSSCPAG
jgi:hypothetical protein